MQPYSQEVMTGDIAEVLETLPVDNDENTSHIISGKMNHTIRHNVAYLITHQCKCSHEVARGLLQVSVDQIREFSRWQLCSCLAHTHSVGR